MESTHGVYSDYKVHVLCNNKGIKCQFLPNSGFETQRSSSECCIELSYTVSSAAMPFSIQKCTEKGLLPSIPTTFTELKQGGYYGMFTLAGDGGLYLLLGFA